MKPCLLDFPTHSHELGNLTYIHGSQDMPFEVRRVYYVYAIPTTAKRGGHAHRSNIEVVIAIAGGFGIDLESPSGRVETFRLDNPRQGLLVPPLYWRTLREYAPDSVCLVLASQDYEAAEYVRDYAEFKRFADVG